MENESQQVVNRYDTDLQKLDKTIKQLESDNKKLRDQQDNLNKAYKQGTISATQFKEQMKQTTGALKQNQALARDLAGALGGLSPQMSGLANSVAGLFTGPLGVISAVSGAITFLWSKIDEARKNDEEKHKAYIASIKKSMMDNYEFQLQRAKAAGGTEVEAIQAIIDELDRRQAELSNQLKMLPTTEKYRKTSQRNRQKMLKEIQDEFAVTMSAISEYRNKLREANKKKTIDDIADRYAKEKEYAKAQADLQKELQKRIEDLQILTIEDTNKQKIAKIELEEKRQLEALDKEYKTATSDNKKLIDRAKALIKETSQLQIKSIKDSSKVSNTEIDKQIEKIRNFIQTYQKDFKLPDPQMATEIQKLNGMLSEEAYLIETRNNKDRELIATRDKELDALLKKYDDVQQKINELEVGVEDPEAIGQLEEKRLEAQQEYENNRLTLVQETNMAIEQNHLETAQQIENIQKQTSQATLDTWSQAIGGIGDIFNALSETESENSKKSLKFQEMGIYMNMAAALAKGISEATSAGFPALLATVPATIALLVTQFAQVKKLKSQAKFATGGYVTGPGSGTSDSINAKLSNGEYVINAKSTAANLSLLQAINNSNGASVIGKANKNDAFFNQLTAAMSNVRPVVSVESIDRANDIVGQVDVLSKL